MLARPSAAKTVMPHSTDSLVAIADALNQGATSSYELTQRYIGRIEDLDSKLNAVVVRDFDRALDAALLADTERRDGSSLGPLHGVPFTVKEAYDVAGLVTCWGFAEAQGYVAAEDAVLPARAKAAGGVLLGKTNVPAGIGDFQSYNDVYGQTNNPWDLERTPGGSSGGSAAAVAAGLSAFDIGSDMGGSLRSPAHFCGVYAHKPTWGILPFRSQNAPGALSVPQDMDMAVGGIMARSAADLDLLLDVLAGPDEIVRDGWCLELPPARQMSLKDFRVAVWPDYSGAPVDQDISNRLAELADELARAGAVVSDSARPGVDAERLWQTYRSLVMAVANMSGSEISYPQWLELHQARGAIRLAWHAFFTDWDVLLCPAHSAMAFPHDHSEPMQRTLLINGEARGYWEHVFWAGLATLAYLPATVMPAGLSRLQLPLGVQAIGGAYQDRTTIAFARFVGEVIGGYRPPPGYGPDSS